MPSQLLSHFEGQSRNLCIVKIVRQREQLHRRGAFDFFVLLADVAGVLDANDHLLDYRVGFSHPVLSAQCFT